MLSQVLIELFQKDTAYWYGIKYKATIFKWYEERKKVSKDNGCYKS